MIKTAGATGPRIDRAGVVEQKSVTRVPVRVRGWIVPFPYANSARVFDKVRWQMREQIQRWLWQNQVKTEAH